MSTCIICRKDIEQGNNDSDEHIIPKAIGGKFVVKNICRNCNNNLGKTVDHWFLEESLIKLLRMIYYLEGESGRVPDLFAFSLYDAQGNKAILARGDGVTTPKIYDDYESKNTAVNVTDDGLIQFQSSSPKHVKRKLQKNSFKQLNLSPEDIDAILSKGKLEYTNELYHFPITFDKANYEPCLYKIAYEYACFCLGSKCLSDGTIGSIREYLIRCMGGEHLSPPSTIESKFNYGELFPSVASYHAIQLDRDEKKLFVRIVLFGKMMFEIPLSENLELFPNDGRIHAIMEPINPIIQNSSLNQDQ